MNSTYRDGGTKSDDSDSEPWSEDEDSKPKLKPKLPSPSCKVAVTLSENNVPKPDTSTEKEGRKVWANVIEEECLSQDILSSCAMQKRKIIYNDRGVESYDYPETHKPHRPRPTFNRKRGSFRPRRQPLTGTILTEDIIPSRPMIFDFNEADPDAVVAKGIARLLNEPKEDLIGRIVKFLGKPKAMELLCKTMEVEQRGGILTKDQSRKRTRGGIFLYLLNNDSDLGKGLKGKIFEEERLLSKEQDKVFKKRQRKSTSSQQAKKMKMEVAQELDPEQLPALPTRMELEIAAAQKDNSEPQKPKDDLEEGEVLSGEEN